MKLDKAIFSDSHIIMNATHRKSFDSPRLALMPWVAVNLWPGTLIIGISTSSWSEVIERL